jgi:hypothetical protein
VCRKWTVGRWVLPLLVCAALAGCGSGPAAEQGEPSIGTPTVVDLATLALPIDAYRPDPQQDLKIRQAQAVLFARCMAERGFPVDDPLPSEVDDERNRDRYMLGDPKAASAYGYHPTELPDTRPAAPVSARSAEFLNAASGKGQSTVNGKSVPKGGCAGEAVRQLNGGGEPDGGKVVSEIRAWSWSRSQQDVRVVATFEAWSRCMGAQGYQYRTPQDANDDPAWSSAEVTQREIATAVADVRCKQEAKVIDTWAAVEAAYQNRAIDEQDERLRVVKSELETRVRTATEVLARA